MLLIMLPIINYGHFKNESKVFDVVNFFVFNNENSSLVILQNDTIVPLDSLIISPVDTINLTVEKDSLINDSLGDDGLNEVLSDNAIETMIVYSAEDSTIFDALNQTVYLYGNAAVTYGDMELTAAYIEFSFKDNIASAEGRLDTAGVLIGKPMFSDDGNEVSQEYLKYNFKTKTGFSKKAITSESGAFLHSENSKIHPNLWVHIEDGKFTTCDAENPHYHFHLNKAIVIPNEKIVSGPVYLKVRKVPLPLALPFGFFPNKKESSHGVIIPGYGFAPNLGFFFKDAGYFYPWNDRFNSKVVFDLYSRGSWKVQNVNQYKTRYKYSGNFKISRTITKLGVPELEGISSGFSRKKDFKVDWFHRQDSKARPGITFNADVHFGTSTNNRTTVTTNIADLTAASYNSAINWSKNWLDKPVNLSVSAKHSQNLRDSTVSVTLPSVSLRWNPKFSSLNKTGIKKGYENIQFSYSSNFINRLSAKENDVRLNNINGLQDKTVNGVKQTYTISKPIKLVNKLISVNPNATWNEYWAFRSIEKNYDSQTEIETTDTIQGFMRAGDFSTSVSANTRVYQMFGFKNAKNIKAIRHVMSPSVGMRWTPKNERTKVFRVDDNGNDVRYNPWASNAHKANDNSEALSMTYSLGNNLEMKVRDRKALKPTTKKIKLIESFRLNSSYNFVPDSLNMANISMSGFTTIAKKLSLNYNASYSPYDRDDLGNRIDRYTWQNKGKLLRLMNQSLTMSTRLKSKTKKKDTEEEEAEFSDIENTDLEEINLNRDNYVDWDIPWSVSLNYTLAMNKVYDVDQLADTNNITSSVGARGDFTLFERWKVGFNMNYDLQNHAPKIQDNFTSSTIDLYWDLHCWEFTAHYSPFGRNKYFNVQLNIKSSLLKDLKLQRRFSVSDEPSSLFR